MLDGADLDPGDLVQFDIREDRRMRLASNPRLVATDEYPSLAHDLKKAGQETVQAAPVSAGTRPSKIVAFEPKSAKSKTAKQPVRRAI